MMKSVKNKIRDSVANVGNLKDQLNCVLKEIHLFSSRIDDMKAHSKEEDLGYKRFADLDSRLAVLSGKFKPGKEASRATMFLIKTIIEALTDGPMSEKDLKALVLEKCKELGIKSTNRGTIAGLNMDVGVACNILYHFGAIEPHNAATSTPSEQKECGKHIQASIDHRWESQLTKYFADCKKEAAAAAAVADVIIPEGVMLPPVDANAAANQGSLSSIDKRLLSPLLPTDQIPLSQSNEDLLLLNPTPSQDLADYSFNLESPAPTTSKGNANNSHPSAANSLAGSNASGGLQISSSERIAQCFDNSGFDDPTTSHMDSLVNLDQSALNDSELMDTLMVMGASPIPDDYDDVSPEDFGAMEVQHDDNISVAQSTKSNPSSTNNINSSSAAVTVGGSKAKGMGSGRRSTASQKLWRIKTPLLPGLDGLLKPEETLKQWSNTTFKESLSLEIEEHLLRRIAGQCDMHIKPTPYRSGTRYLDANSVSFEDAIEGITSNACTTPSGGGASSDAKIGLLSHSSSVSLNTSTVGASTVPALYDDHVSITGSYLLDKVKRSKRQRGACLYGSGSSIPQFNINYIHSLSNVSNSTTSHYWNNTLKHTASAAHGNALNSSASTTSLSSFVTGGSTSKKLSSVSGGKSNDGTPHSLYPKHYSHPTAISNETMPMPVDRRPTAASGNKAPIHNIAMYMPDLSIYTTEEPWSTVSKEFVVLSGEDAGAVFFEAANASKHGSHGTVSGGDSKKKISKGDSNGNLTKAANQNSSSSSSKKALLPTYDVAAPQFREVIPPPHKFPHGVKHTNSSNSLSSGIGGGVFYPSPNKTENSERINNMKLSPALANNSAVSTDDLSEEEDLSDEAVLARHDAVLRNMREKWALLQQLKMETRRGAGGDFTTYKKLPGGQLPGVVDDADASALGVAAAGGPYPGSGTHMKYRKYQNGESGSGIAVGSTKKRGYSSMSNGANGSSAMKRRGRPPKFVKSSGTSQRGNNQYTAIRAAAAAAAALSLQLQQQQQQQETEDSPSGNSPNNEVGSEDDDEDDDEDNMYSEEV